jgi:hypothetical protein
MIILIIVMVIVRLFFEIFSGRHTQSWWYKAWQFLFGGIKERISNAKRTRRLQGIRAEV